LFGLLLTECTQNDRKPTAQTRDDELFIDLHEKPARNRSCHALFKGQEDEDNRAEDQTENDKDNHGSVVPLKKTLPLHLLSLARLPRSACASNRLASGSDDVEDGNHAMPPNSVY
jgi:hypothetical protein